MRKIKYFFIHDLKLLYKFLTVNLILVLIPTVVIVAFIYGRLSTIIKSNTLESEKALISQTEQTLEETINRLQVSMNNIADSSFLARATYSDDLSDYLIGKRYTNEEAELFSNINSLIDGQFIKSIRIYLPSKDTNITKNFLKKNYPSNEILGQEAEITGSYWHGIFNGVPDIGSIYCPPSYLSPQEVKNYGSKAYIREISNKANTDVGNIYVAIYIKDGYIEELLKNDLAGNGSVYYLINERNEMVSSSNASLAGAYMMRYEDIPDLIGTDTDFAERVLAGQKVYLSYRDLLGTGWRLVSVIPTENVLSSSRTVLIRTGVLYAIFVGCALVAAFGLSTIIARRLSAVVDRMNEQREDNKPARFVEEKGKDEIGQLVANYNNMIDRIDGLMEEQTIIAEKLKVSEVNALQAQINPHFLYNMLDMINWLAKAGKSEQVSTAVQTLSRFYKLTLSKKEIFTSIGEELRHAELYVRLQNMRYEDKINFIIDVPEEIYDIKIPKLVLQPIVENSIQHGIFEKESKSGDVVIMGWSEGEDVVFVVSDTGMGIEPEKLPHILSGDANGSGSNIGIYNTHLRLQLLYGEGYGLKFDSRVGEGTEVTVRIKA